MLKDDFCTIGIGQGGGKMTNCFYKNGYRSFFINTSFDDLSQLNIDNLDFVYQPPGSKGCAKQRPTAQQYAHDYYEVMIKKLLDAHTTCKVYIVHFTLGGGTGGGLSNMFMALLRKKLKDINKKNVILIAVVAKPKKYEPWLVQNNAKESMEEVYAMYDKGIIDQYYTIDNDSRSSLEDINEEHFLLFDRWIEGEEANNKNNADESERMDLFKKGHAMMFEFDGSDENKFKINLQKAYEGSIYCKPLRNPNGIGIALNTGISEEIAMPIVEEIVGVFPKSHTTPTQVSNMIMLASYDKNPAIKNNIVKIINEKVGKINEAKNDEEETVEVNKINPNKISKEDSSEDDMDMKDIWDWFKKK